MPGLIGVGRVGRHGSSRGVPAWVLSGAALDLDFANGRGFNSIDRAKLTPNSILTYANPSAKMVYGSDGVLRYAPHNLLLQSQTFNTTWSLGSNSVTDNQDVAPDGTTTADLVTMVVASGVFQTIAVTASTTYTFSFWAKRGTKTNLQYRVYNNTGAANITAPTSYYSSTSAGAFSRITHTFTTPAGCISLRVYIDDSNDGTSGTFLVWGAQLNLGSSALTYIPTTTAARYSLPIDHDPTTFAPLGVLIEEQRTNLLTYSEQFNDAAWSKSDATVTANAAVAPNGTTTADKLIPNAAATNGRAIQVVAGTIGATYTLTVFGKQGEFTNCRLYADDGGSNVASVSYNLSTGVVSTAAAVSGGNWTAVSTTITPSYDGYYRMSLTWTATTVAPSRYGVWCRDTGDGTSGIYIWGAQLEAGAFATSYIPTVASQVTRAADNVSILTSAFAYDQTEGTLCSTSRTVVYNDGGAAYRTQVTFRNAGNTNFSARIRLQQPTTTTMQPNGLIINTTTQADLLPIAVALTEMRAAFAYKLNNAAMSVNGAAAVTDESCTIPSDMSSLEMLGGAYNNGATHIKRLTYFPTRRSNADLQVLST